MQKSGTAFAIEIIHLEKIDMYKYPRTMDQAFPFGANYAASVYKEKTSWIGSIASAAAFLALFACLLVLMLSYFDVLVH